MAMTKQEALEDGQQYANMINGTVYLLRRGGVYKTSVITPKGWRVAEILMPKRNPSQVSA